MAQCGLPLELPPTVLTQVKHFKYLLELYHLEDTHETKSETILLMILQRSVCRQDMGH